MNHRPPPQVIAVVAGAVIAFCFVGSMLAALRAPEPHDLPVAVVAPAAVADRVGGQLDQNAPGAFDPRAYPDADAATDAIRDGDVAGAFVLTDPTGPRLLLAGAWGAPTEQVLRGAFEGMVTATGGTVTEESVSDLEPLGENDRLGLGAVALTIGTLIGSVVAGVILGLAARTGARATLAALGGSVGSAALLAAGGVWAAAGLAGALPGHTAALYGGVMLFSFAVIVATAAVTRVIGVAGAPLMALLFIILGLPSTGLVAGRDFVPGAYQWFGQVLPTGQAAELLRRIAYFGGNGTAGALWTMIAWAGAGILVVIAGTVARALGARRRPPEPVPVPVDAVAPVA